MPAIVRSYEWATHDHGISQNSRKAQQKRLVTPLTDRNTRETRPISSHRTVMRKAHRLLGQKMDLRYPQAYHVHASVIRKGKSPSGSMGATGQSTRAPARSSVSVCTRRAPQRLCGACRTANACPSFLPHGSEGLFLAWRAPGCVQALAHPLVRA